ncbi:MAG TPA: hypothetical protein VJO53_12255 [Candidatus Acidoferrales bacterium]|nr:hypothetical protein [Candidatus Acidoferrales bacterium]
MRRYFAILLLLTPILWLQSGCGGSGGGTPQAPPPVPTFTTIDAPGAGPGGTFAEAINGNGEVTGFFFDASHGAHGFVRDSAGMVTTIDAPGAIATQGLGTEATGINASGTIVGFFVDQTPAVHNFIRTSDGTFTVFDAPGSQISGAVSINDGGVAAGGFLDANGAHGFVRATDGTITTFDIPGFAAGQVRIVVPTQINASGMVAGSYIDSSQVFHGFLRDTNGAITTLDAPGAGATGGTGTEASDINSSGVIAGVFRTGASGGVVSTHSFLRAADGKYTVFDPPKAGPSGSLAAGINASGAVVGTYSDASQVRHGYLRNSGGTFTTIDDPSAAQLPFSAVNIGTVPRHINASGAIVGIFSDAAGTRHGFLRE